MIEFAPYLSWSLTFGFIALLSGLLGYLAIVILRSNLSKRRKWIKLALNSWLILLLTAFLLQPSLKKETAWEPLLLHATGIPSDRLAFLKDSLQVDQSLEIGEYKGEGNPLYLIGQDYSLEELYQLKDGKKIEWIPEFKDGQVTSMRWEGIVRQGGRQVITGSMMVKDSTKITVEGFGETLVETTLSEGKQRFELSFTAMIPGRNELDFKVDGEVKDRLHFFVTPTLPFTYELAFGAPNAESRHLTEFLTAQGNHVDLTIQISRDMDIRSTSVAAEEANVLITDPSQLNRKDVEEALANGSNLLIINLSDPATEVPLINQQLGTDFKMEKETNLEAIEIKPNLYSWPYKFTTNLRQREVIGGTVVYQHLGNSKVALSLLQSTYPLALGGDSIRYNKVWDQILGALVPPEKTTYQIGQPSFIEGPTTIKAVQGDGRPEFLIFGKDSIMLEPSRINPFSASAVLVPKSQGWQPLNDSLEIYSYDEGWDDVQSLKRVIHFIQSTTGPPQDGPAAQRINGWIWLVLLLISFGMLWLEPRI